MVTLVLNWTSHKNTTKQILFIFTVQRWKLRLRAVDLSRVTELENGICSQVYLTLGSMLSLCDIILWYMYKFI